MTCAALRRTAGGPNPNNAFNKPLMLSEELAAFVGQPAMARGQVVKFFWAYFKDNGLQVCLCVWWGGEGAHCLLAPAACVSATTHPAHLSCASPRASCAPACTCWVHAYLAAPCCATAVMQLALM